MKTIDDALILFIETEKKDVITNMDSLGSIDWPTLCKDDSTNQIIGYPDLIALMSKEMKDNLDEKEADNSSSSSSSSNGAFDERLEALDLTKKEQVQSLLEIFPLIEPFTVLSVLEDSEFNVEVCSETLLELKGQEGLTKQVQTMQSSQKIGSSKTLSARFDIIKQLNRDFSDSIELINFNQSEQTFSISHMVGKCRQYLLYVTKTDLFNQALSKSSGSGDAGEISISRSKALKFTLKGECDTSGLWSIYGQTFRALHGKPATVFRQNKEQLWRVLFAGERGHDAGGLYRELFTMFSAELMSKSLPLLIPCANSSALMGHFLLFLSFFSPRKSIYIL